MLLFGCHSDPLTLPAVPVDIEEEPKIENPVTGPRSLEFSGFQAVNFRRAEDRRKNQGGFSFELRTAGEQAAVVTCEGFLVPSPIASTLYFRGQIIDASGQKTGFEFPLGFSPSQIELPSGETVNVETEVIEDRLEHPANKFTFARCTFNGQLVGCLFFGSSVRCSVEPGFPEDMRLAVAGTLAGFYFNIMEERSLEVRSRTRSSD